MGGLRAVVRRQNPAAAALLLAPLALVLLVLGFGSHGTPHAHSETRTGSPATIVAGVPSGTSGPSSHGGPTAAHEHHAEENSVRRGTGQPSALNAAVRRWRVRRIAAADRREWWTRRRGPPTDRSLGRVRRPRRVRHHVFLCLFRV